MQAIQAMQVSVRHTHITDLVAEQRAEVESLRSRYENVERDFNNAIEAFRKLYKAELSQLSKKHEEEKDALRAALWQRAKNAFAVACKLKYDERRETLKAVLKSRSMPVEKLDELMTEYTKWLITFEEMNKNGPLLNRWVLMTTFVSTHQFA
jgi:hypothetical protein